MLPKEAHPNVWLLRDVDLTTELLGCGSCLDRHACGGLHLENGSAMLTCMDLCRCDDPDTCDVVCPRAPLRFVRRVREVGGFQFDGIPVREFPSLPIVKDCIPIVEGRVTPRRPLEIEYAAIPLTRALTGQGRVQRAKTREELVKFHGVAPRKGWIATGVEDDRFVERIWRLPKHREIFKAMHEAGVIMATTPNFSLYADTPRHDNLHAMKRIAWMWYIMNEAGLPTALHVNGRTAQDFQRWSEFIIGQPSVTAIAFEFLTGAKQAEDAHRYVERLKKLRKTVARPLTIVVRGAAKIALELEEVFENVIWLDATPYFRAMHRHEPVVTSSGMVRYAPRGGDRNAPIGGLFKRAVMAAEMRFHSQRNSAAISIQRELDLSPVDLPPDVRADHETGQKDLFTEDPGAGSC